MTGEPVPMQLLDDLAEELVARGFRESVQFSVVGRRPRRMLSSQLHFIGYSDGIYSCWYRESAERNVLCSSEDFEKVRDVFVRAVEREVEFRQAQFEKNDERRRRTSHDA